METYFRFVILDTRKKKPETILRCPIFLIMFKEIEGLSKARENFHCFNHRYKQSWNSLIVGCIRSGEPQQALKVYTKLSKGHSLHLSDRTFVALLKACATVQDLRNGLALHAEAARLSLVEQNLFVGSTLVDMYAKCGLLEKAQEVFYLLPAPNIVSWTALLLGFAEMGHGEKALLLFEQMQMKGISPNAVTLVCGLKACCSIGAVERGRIIHSEIEKQGLISKDSAVGNALITMYSKCGCLVAAQEVFNKLPIRDVVSWTTLITGYAEHGHDEEALACLKQMQWEGVPLDTILSVCGLKTCCNINALDTGQAIHAEVERRGLLTNNLVIANTLIDFYAKLGFLSRAQDVFDKLSVRNVFTWAPLIAGYVEHGNSVRALECFEQMQYAVVIPDAVIYVCCMKACGVTGAVEKGREIHAEVERRGLSQRNIVVGNTVVDMYTKWGLLRTAQQVFDKLPAKNVVSWNALITGFSDQDFGEEVLMCLEQMQLDGISPNIISVVCGLKACGSVGATAKGREIHGEVARLGLLETDDLIGNTLIDMYAKCGLLATAQEVFDYLPVRDIVSWNCLITGYVHLGETKNVLDIFDRMHGDSVRPDLITFVVILNACSRTGLFDKSQVYFEAMSRDYGIVSASEHFAGIIDLFCRAGHLDKALAVIRKVPCNPNIVMWRTMLGACRSWGNVDFGREAFMNVMHLNQKDSSAYVLLSQTYALAECIRMKAK